MMEDEFPKFCRLCLRETANLINVVDPKGYKGFRLGKIIEELLQIEVSSNDGLPGMVCNCCAEKVREFKLLKMTCIQIKIKFLEMIVKRDFECNLEPKQEPEGLISNSGLVMNTDGDAEEILELKSEETQSLSPVVECNQQFNCELDIEPAEIVPNLPLLAAGKGNGKEKLAEIKAEEISICDDAETFLWQETEGDDSLHLHLESDSDDELQPRSLPMTVAAEAIAVSRQARTEENGNEMAASKGKGAQMSSTVDKNHQQSQWLQCERDWDTNSLPWQHILLFHAD